MGLPLTRRRARPYNRKAIFARRNHAARHFGRIVLTAKQNRSWLLGILILAIVATAIALSPKVRTYYGLDIQGGVRVVLRARTEEYKGGQWTSDKLEAVRRILENRINASGVSEPVIITKPPDQIVVELPGVKDKQAAIDQLSSTANLQFYLLPQLGDKDGARPATWTIRQTVNPKTGGKDDVLVDLASGKELTPEQIKLAVFDREPIVTGKDLLPNSHAVIDPSSSNPVIEFEFNADGSRIFEETTRANVGKFLAIFLDNRLLTAPSINGPIPGRGIIQGSFTLESAKALSDQLNAGALPVPLDKLEVRTLEATLGREAVAATTRAGMVGLALVLLFMLFYYRLPGVVASVALILYAIFSLAVFKTYPITLTLPGIAGFILSIGMAVDANILIFERLKEELRTGKTLRAAIEAGFKRAFTAIFDSNVCTVGTCVVLYNFGTGPIRGFALTLGLGVAISMFTAITVTRTFLFALVGRGAAYSPTAWGLNRQWAPRLNTMRRWRLWLGISGGLIVLGLIAIASGGIKRSIDFSGGTELQIPFAQRYSADTIQRALIAINPKFRDSRVVVSGDPGASSTPAYVTTERLTQAERENVITTLTGKVGPLATGQNVAYADVSGTISRELTINAVEAVLIASLLIVLYLAVRFSIGGLREGLKYGVCAVIALLHDVLVLLGAFAILGLALNWQIDSLFVTAMLTVIGFSVHDTIIIFDRIRENLQNRQKGESFSDLTDRSIDQTIARSINTSLTVVLTLLALVFFGGGQIKQFSVALLIGIISGTYSSIFNASVLLVRAKQNDKAPTSAGAGLAGARSLTPARATSPGDRPILTPRPATATGPAATSSGGARVYSSPESEDETESASPASASSRAARPNAPRRAPGRRRRM